MSSLATLLSTRLSSGLRRASISTCSKWAETYRVMGQPYPGLWSFKHHPWTKDIHNTKEEVVVCQKGAQLGLTETALNKVFHAIDVNGTSVLYVLPAATPDAANFSTSRFDPALEMSDHLRNLFSDVKNIGHKRAGSANLYIRGSRSRSQLKSVPVGLVVLDEIDEMVQANIPLVFERMAGQVERQCFMLSTPTIDNHGINHWFRQSSQDVFMFRCPSCNKLTQLAFPECLVVTADSYTDPKIMNSHLICKECQAVLPHDTKPQWLATGQWIPTHTDRIIKGYHVNQLYSPTETPAKIAVNYLKAQTNPADEQEFYNSKLGLTRVVKGSRITDEVIDKCISSYKNGDRAKQSRITCMGIDVGKWLHFEITEYNIDLDSVSNDINLAAEARVLETGKVLNFEELDWLMTTQNVNFAVIDANPERRKALEFAQRFWCKVRLCFYAIGVNGKQLNVHSEEEHTVSVDRTSWMDLSLGRVNRSKIRLPMDVSQEYRSHLKAPVRIYKKDQNGNPVGVYITADNDEDHFAHARTYSEIALPLAASLITHQDVSNIV